MREPPPATGNTRWSRTNRDLRRGLVVATLEALQRHGEMTIRELAPAVGMSIVTANKLLGELAEEGTVRTVARRPADRGPKPRLFRLPDAQFVTVHVADAAITAKAGGFDDNGPAVTTTGDAGPGQLADLTVRAVRAADPAPGTLSGVVVGNSPRSRQHSAHLAADVAERLGVPVRVHSNAYLAAIAEARIGAGRGRPAFVLVSADPEMTVTLVRDGRPHDGAHGVAGIVDRMIPHLSVDGVAPPLRRAVAAIVLACLVTDPELVVLARDVATGPAPVRAAVAALVLSPPRIVVSTVPGDPVLAGARLLASAATIEDLADRSTSTIPPNLG